MDIEKHQYIFDKIKILANEEIDECIIEEFKYNLGKNAKNILEIGYKTGYSTLLFLISNPDTNIVCFDMYDKTYEYINSIFPNRVKLIKNTIEKYIEDNPSMVFDLVHIKNDLNKVLPLIDYRYNRIISENNQLIDKNIIRVIDQSSNYILGELKIPIIVSTSDNYKDIFDIFEKSLKLSDNKNIQLFVNNIDLSNYKDFGFRTDSWYKSLELRLSYLYNIMNLPEYKDRYIIFTDADIQYFQPHKLSTLIYEAKTMNLDYYGMQEHNTNSYNGGFIIAKCNENIKLLFKTVINNMKRTRKPYGCQTEINNLIHIFNIKHKMVPSKYVVWGNSSLPTKDTIFHHAVCAADVDSKVEQMKYIKSLLKN